MSLTRSLRARMTLLFTGVTVGLLLLVAAGLVGYTAFAMHRSTDRALVATERRIRRELSESHGRISPGELIREEGSLLEQVDGALLILDGQGQFVARSRWAAPRWPRRGEDGWRVRVVRAANATVVIGVPWHRYQAALVREAELLLVLVVCVAFVVAVGVWVLVGRTLRPIRLLVRQVEGAPMESLRGTLAAPSEDAELVELVHTLNQLLSRLDQTVAARGRFYAAASHELRTPLQALSGHLELSLTRPRTVEEYREVVREAFGQTRRLTRLVQDLLLLNQLHQRTSLPPSEPLDLVDVVQRSVRQFQSAFQSRHLELALDLPDDAEVELPPSHVEVLVRNLVENAAKYAVPETTVTIGLVYTPGQWHLTIRNACTDEIPAQADRLFEPFYRPDASRSSRTGGNGLGLATCKAVSDLHGWVLLWRREATGVCVEVRLPASASPLGAPAPPPKEKESCPAPALASP